MKKTTLIALFSIVVAMVFLLSSCLGDTKNVISSTGEFVYVTTVNNKRMAAFSQGYMVSSEFDNFNLGDCAIVGYKLDLENTSGVAFVPDYVTVDPLKKFPSVSQFKANETSVYPSDDVTKADIIGSFTPSGAVGSDHYGDRRLINFSCKAAEADTPEIQVYFNPDKQIDANRELELGGGVCILDVVLNRPNGITGDMSTQYYQTVVDFSRLRGLVKKYAKKNDYGYEEVKFRYRYLVASSASEEEYRLVTQSPLTGFYYSSSN